MSTINYCEPYWQVSSISGVSMTLRAPNWMIALGKVLQGLGTADQVAHMACERRENGCVIVHDRSGTCQYVLRSVPEVLELDASCLMPLEEDMDTEEVLLRPVQDTTFA